MYSICEDIQNETIIPLSLIIFSMFEVFIIIAMQLTTFVQLNGNISAICEMSRNNMRQVIRRENSAQNTIKRIRPINGSRNKPTCKVPAEHSHARQAADDNYHIISHITYIKFIMERKQKTEKNTYKYLVISRQ